MQLLKWLLAGLVLLSVIWYLLTLYVQRPGQAFSKDLSKKSAEKKALLVFDPDPFFNLDEIVCTSFAHALNEFNFNAHLRSPSSVNTSLLEGIDLLVLCSNTYNWAPDNGIRSFWENYPNPEGQKTVLITLGGGSTARSRRLMEKAIVLKNADLIGSEEFWAWKPNDEERMDEKNIDVAREMAYEWASTVLDKQFTD
ncbi:MAG TPA: hypothetical protein VJ917_12880 [Saprospiraceae bacterium]|nr:hypothetical protein [Saprospiraceae bacterium]